MQARELQARLERGEAILLLDVREDAELELAQLAHPVVHLPLSRSTDRIGDLHQLFDRDRAVRVVCRVSVRSWHLGCWLIREHGFVAAWNPPGALTHGASRWIPACPGTKKTNASTLSRDNKEKKGGKPRRTQPPTKM